MIQATGVFTDYVPPAILAGVAAAVWLLTQWLKIIRPALQGRVTLIVATLWALLLAILVQGAMWQAGQEYCPWTYHGLLQILLTTLLGSAGAVGGDSIANVAKAKLAKPV